MKTNYYNKIDILKFFAYICVFFQHTGFKYTKFGAWGVSLFLILSGFLLTSKHYENNDFDNYSFKDCFNYAFCKIKPIYFLHLLCMLFYIPSLFIGNVKYSFIGSILRILLNIFLVQEWLPIQNSSLNECSWFLSAIVLCYFVFPFILNVIKKYVFNTKKSLFYIAILFILQILVSLFSYYLFTPNNININYWLVYRFPFTRLLDFAIGCLLYVVYKNSTSINKRYCSILEIIGLVLMLVTFVFNIVYIDKSSLCTGLINTFLYSAVYTPCICILVYSFALGKGVISNKLYCKNYKNVNDVNKYMFLIHYLVFDVIRVILTVLNKYYLLNLTLYSPIIKSTIGLLFSYYLSLKWRTLYLKKRNR